MGALSSRKPMPMLLATASPAERASVEVGDEGLLDGGLIGLVSQDK